MIDVLRGEHYQAGFQSGRAWAEKKATPEQVKRIFGYLWTEEGDTTIWWESGGWNQILRPTDFFFLAAVGKKKRDFDLDEADSFWRSTVFHEADRRCDLQY